MSVFLSPVGGAGAQFFDNNGNPLTGGKLYTYAAGTTTPQATYTSAAGSVFHSNPIILDAAGRVPGSSEIWLSDSAIYKFVLKTGDDVLLATWDQITGVNSNFVNFTAQTEVQTATAGQTVFTLTSISYQPGTGSLTVFVDGVNQYEGTSYLETDGTTVTFTAGLHVGALVKFTTAVQTTGNATDASVVTYDPPFTGSVATTVEAKLAQTVSIIDFGADPTGVADSTSAIQDAVDAAGQNGLIYYPAGTYKMLGTVTLLPEQTHFGHDAILDIDPTVPNGFELTTNGFPGRIKFENLKFNTSAKNGIAISITNNTPFVQINNCFFDGFSTAVYLDGSYCSNIVNSYFNDCFQGVILVAECHSTQLINCFFDYCLYGGVCINGNQTLGNLGSDTHNISIIGCAIQNGEFGVWAESCYELQLINTYHEGNTKQDLRIGVADAGTYARACYHVNIDNWQSASPCGSGVNIGIEHSVNVNMRGMSWNSGCSTTATLLSIDGFSDFIQVDYNNYTTSVVTSTAPFNFGGNAARRTVVLHNGRLLFPRDMTDAIQFGTLVTQPEKIYSSTTSSGRPALFLQSVGTDQDMVVKVTGIERHQNAAGVDQFYVDHVNGQVVSEYLMKAKLGVVMTTPDGTKNYRIWIDNSGNLTSTLV